MSSARGISNQHARNECSVDANSSSGKAQSALCRTTCNKSFDAYAHRAFSAACASMNAAFFVDDYRYLFRNNAEYYRAALTLIRQKNYNRDEPHLPNYVTYYAIITLPGI